MENFGNQRIQDVAGNALYKFSEDVKHTQQAIFVRKLGL